MNLTYRVPERDLRGADTIMRDGSPTRYPTTCIAPRIGGYCTLHIIRVAWAVTSLKHRYYSIYDLAIDTVRQAGLRIRLTRHPLHAHAQNHPNLGGSAYS